MTFSWDINTATLIAIGVQIVFLIVLLVKIDMRTKAAHELAQKAERLAAEAHAKIDAQIDMISHQFGETIAAIREKINIEVSALRREMTDDQKFVRDNFVRRESFIELSKALQTQMHQLDEKIDTRFERMEAKMDSRHEGRRT